MADNLRKYTTQEVLNKVFTDSSGNAIGINSSTTKETLNAVFSTSDNSLNVALSGGTISGDVTISGDLTVNGSATNSYDEIVNGQLVAFRDDSSTVGTNDNIVIENDGTGDASLKFSLTGATDWFAYVDNSDSDKFKIRRSTSDYLEIDESGNATFSGDLTVSGGDMTLTGTITSIIGEQSAGATRGKIKFATFGSDGDIVFETTTNGAGAITEAMRLDHNGDMGIGTGTSIDKKLHITSSTSTDGIKIEQSGTGASMVTFFADGSERGFIGVDDSDGGAFLSSTSGSDYVMVLRSAQEMHFGTNGNNTALTIDSSQNAIFSGDVTIKTGGGSDDPATLALWSADTSIADNDTIGTILAQGSDSGGSPPYLGAKIEFNADANWDTSTSGYYPTRIDFFTESNSGTVSTASPRMTLDSSGRVGMGASPSYPLHVENASDTVAYFKSTDNNGQIAVVDDDTTAYFGANGSRAFMGTASGLSGNTNLVVDSNGNVVVGQTTAQQKFEVHGGGIRIAGNITTPSSGVTGALIDYYGSDTRFWSRGADASTVGSFKFIGLENDGGNQSTQLEIDNSSATFTQPVDGDAYIALDNVNGGSSSVNETAALRLNLGDGSTIRGGAKITAKKEADYSTGANMDASLTFSVLENNGYNNALTIAPSGNATFAGSISKGSGSFKIDHPLESKKDTHHLVHSFVEAPQADNIYRGKATLSNGSIEINIDTISGMSEGTFVLLNTDIQCFTSNESNWDAVKGSVSGNILTISCQNTDSTATVSWLVIGERQDQHMLDTSWTDENGKVIVEPEKPEEESGE
jgi:lipopolysaccharide export system protein LptA